MEGFLKRNRYIKTRIGKKIGASRWNGATPQSINWYSDIREGHYDWIKLDNSYNADKGSIIAGFGTSKYSVLVLYAISV
jgi:hypothetical protein